MPLERGPLLAALLPPQVVIAEMPQQVDDASAAGRDCARRALLDLGIEPAPVNRGAHGEPLWPPGVVGSITHCAGYTAAAVARGDQVIGLGIDAEAIAPLTSAVVELVCTERERRMIGDLPGDHWALVLFSAKESVFKAWFPLTGQWLEYGDVHIELDVVSGRFGASIRGSDRGIDGRFAVGEARVLTAALLFR